MYPDLLETDYRVYIACTGAGAGIQQHLWAIPGISKVFVGSSFPYAKEEMVRFLGFEPEKFVSEQTAVAMAMESYKRALKDGHRAIGIGLTASVATTEIHRGDHRIAVAYMTDTQCKVFSVTLKKDKGFHARDWDGYVADNAGLYMLEHATGCHIKALDTHYLGDPNIVSWSLTNGKQDAEDLIRKYPIFTASGIRSGLMYLASRSKAIFPGAFNPPHEAHRWIADKTNSVFAISAHPPHKEQLSVQDCIKRAANFEGRDVMFTFDDPLFTDKAKKFPCSTLVIGADAFQRMCDPKWGVSLKVLSTCFYEYETRLIIVDRLVDGKLLTLKEVLPPELTGLDVVRLAVPVYLQGMSSTQIRECTK